MPLDLPFDPIARAERSWRVQWGDNAPAGEMAAATSILRVAQILTAAFDAACAPHGLTFARYEALVLLTFSRSGELSMSRIGERLMVHPTSATSIVQRLAKDGLVERVPNPDDGRGVLARITPAGRDAVQGATRALHGVAFGLGSLDDAAREELFATLRRLRVAAGDFAD